MKHFRRTIVVLLSAILVVTACVPFAGAGEQTTVETTAATEPSGTAATEPAGTAATGPTGETIRTTEAATEPSTEPESTGETTEPESTEESTEATEPESTEESTEAPSAEENNASDVFTISFDLNGGVQLDRSGEYAAFEAATNDTIVLPMAPDKEERTFAGWKSARTGELYQAEADYKVLGDDTLTAQWDMLQLLGVSMTPANDSALRSAEDVVTAISEDAQEKVSNAVDKALGEGAVQSLDVLAADISFVSGGQELQPASDESVPVTLTVPGDRIDENAAFLVVYHMARQADGSYYAEPVQYVQRTSGSQDISFGATGFSIYAVASVGKTGNDMGSQLVKGSESHNVLYEMEEEQSQVFFFQDEHTSQYTYHRYVWTVQDNDDTVRAYSHPLFSQGGTTIADKYQYPWMTVDALRPGRVTVRLTYYCYNGENWWSPTGTPLSGTVEFKLEVTECDGGLVLENHLPENGTLVPKWRGTSVVNVDRYVWTKTYFHTYNDGTDASEPHANTAPIDQAALRKDGSLNVAIDAGGIAMEKDSQGRDILCVKSYTCTAYDENGKELGSATHRVEYGGNILNGSFEYPRIPTGNNYAFANGTRQLFWQTTAPGDGKTLGQDVELGNDSAGNPYLTSGGKANDGTQYAEVNAEKAGTLYQDVLTSPGGTLNWAFAHRSRKGSGTNVLYLVIASTVDGQKVVDQATVNALVQQYSGDGAAVDYNGGRYTLWKFEGNENSWQNHLGEYKVPDGQYSTRFFFASASGTTLGNLLDGISFNESQRYVIEYYLNGKQESSLTEVSTAEMNTVVTPKYNAENSDVLKNAVLSNSTINGEPYGGVTLSIKARENLDSEYKGLRNVLRLYYTTGTASVTKVVDIKDWDSLTSQEKQDINGADGYTASFKLYDADTDTVVATASVTINLVEYAQKTAVAVFMDAADSEKPFAPAQNHRYRVVEDARIPANGSDFDTIYSEQVAYSPEFGNVTGALLQTNDAGTGTCTVTNTYTPNLTTLTIRKQGWKEIDENQTFVYRLQGVGSITKDVDLIVTVHGNRSTTIDHLPYGTYTVKEIKTWSWRYTPELLAMSVSLNAANQNVTVTFQNNRAPDVSGNQWRWLNGSDWAENRWKNGQKLGPDNEGGEQG